MNNIPVPHFPRRREIFLLGLLAGLLAPITFAYAQASPAALPAKARTPALGSAWGTERQPEIADFNAWARKLYKSQMVSGNVAEPDAATLAEGMRLAERRRAIMAALVYTDPARALASGIPAVVRAKLPASVLSRLETPFSTMGDFSVDNRSGQREITLDDRTYRAHVYGQQSALTSQSGTPLRGFVLDGEAVLDTSTDHHAAPQAVSAGHPQKQRAPVPQVVYGNDPFSGALQLFGTSGSINDDNIGATKEPGEPNHAGDVGGASVWYVWTPLNSGEATFITDDGDGGLLVDTLLAAYTGFDVADLTAVASNDDAMGFNSQIDFFAQAGVTYYIAVDGYRYAAGPSEGNYTLNYYQQGDPFSPSITSDDSIEVEVNTLLVYTITATNNPTTFTATGLPAGVTLDPNTGVISGTPTAIGSYYVLVSASNSDGTGTIGLTISVSDVPVHFPFFRTEVALPQDPGFYYLHLPNGNIFGYYSYLDDSNFIYHLDLGYEYTFDANDGKNGIYFYDFASSDYFYTSPSFPFPYLYDFNLNAFLYYFPDPIRDARYNTNGVRYFYNFSTGQIITK